MIVTGVADSGAPVLVIGAGPAGMFAAAELARHGVPARVVEREPHPHRQARATSVQPGTLEILAQAGLADEFAAVAVHMAFSRVFDPALRLVAKMTFAGTDSPWDYSCSLPQWRTEQILGSQLTELGGTVERGTEVLSVRSRGNAMLTELRHPDGATEAVESGWLIGAGGAHSITRESLAGELAGETYPGTALVGDVQVTGGLPRDGSALIASPEGYVLLAPLPDDRWITFIGDLRADEAALLTREVSPAAVAGILRRRVPDAVQLTDVGWASTFRMHRRMAPRLAGERWFLLGDAGHLSSPFGGEGLNAGLHDAHNLAWKLALEIQGRARPVLVRSYEPERDAASQHVLATSDQIHQLAHAAVDFARTGVAAKPLTPAAAAALTRARAMIDVSYAGSPLVGEYSRPELPNGTAGLAPGCRYPGWQPASGEHHLLVSAAAPGEFAGFADRWAGLLRVVPDNDGRAGAPGGRPVATLIRPDGYVGFRAAPADSAGLAALDAHLSSYLIPR